MLFTQRFSKFIAVFAVCAVLVGGLPTRAQNRTEPPQNAASTAEATVAKSNTSGLAESVEKDRSRLIAQATCATCGAELNPLVLMAASGKSKDSSPLTDSLWGNLILELAYQRDKDLQKIAKKMNVANLGTMAAIGTITGGTLAQGIVALEVLNPQDGHLDSYCPLIIGTALSGVTLMVFMARMMCNHRLSKQITDRQIAIKKHVELILAHMESSAAKCADAKKELTELIGERACREWVQLYQSSHQLAMTSPRRFSMLNIPGHTDL